MCEQHLKKKVYKNTSWPDFVKIYKKTNLVSDLALDWTWELFSLKAKDEGGNMVLLSIMLLSNSGAIAISSKGDSDPTSSSDDSSVSNR